MLPGLPGVVRTALYGWEFAHRSQRAFFAT
jgi:hypothetical protein